MNRNYELVVILNPDLKDKEQEELLEKIKKVVTAAEGKISKVNGLGKKELSYPVAKSKAGIFYVVEMSIPPGSIASLREKLQLEEKILRQLLIVKEGESPKEV